MATKIPSLNFVYSPVYDKAWHVAFKKPYEIESGKKQFNKTIKAIESAWDKSKQQKSLRKISKILKLNWQLDPIKIYFVNELTYSGISDPLTLKIKSDTHFMIQTIIHEATHVLLSQNDKQIRPGLKYLKKQYPNELPGTRLHLIVNTVADSVLETEINSSKINKIKSELKKFKGLKRAYEILDNIDSPQDLLGQVIKKFKK